VDGHRRVVRLYHDGTGGRWNSASKRNVANDGFEHPLLANAFHALMVRSSRFWYLALSNVGRNVLISMSLSVLFVFTFVLFCSLLFSFVLFVLSVLSQGRTERVRLREWVQRPVRWPVGRGFVGVKRVHATHRRTKVLLRSCIRYCLFNRLLRRLQTTAYYCILLHTTAYYCILLHTIAYYCILLHTIAHYCILLQMPPCEYYPNSVP
jgi:hypothetical protein